jgi:hypothetical protein
MAKVVGVEDDAGIGHAGPVDGFAGKKFGLKCLRGARMWAFPSSGEKMKLQNET